MHADTLCAPEIFDNMLSADGDIVLPVDFKPCDDEAMKVQIENEAVTKITKQMPVESAAGEFIGIALLRKEILPELKLMVRQALKEKLFNEYFESAIQKLINLNKYKIKAVSTDNYFWGEVDFVEDYDKVLDTLPDNLYNIASSEWKE